MLTESMKQTILIDALTLQVFELRGEVRHLKSEIEHLSLYTVKPEADKPEEVQEILDAYQELVREEPYDWSKEKVKAPDEGVKNEPRSFTKNELMVPSAKAVRDWAEAEGIFVKPMGPLPLELREQFIRAHL